MEVSDAPSTLFVNLHAVHVCSITAEMPHYEIRGFSRVSCPICLPLSQARLMSAFYARTPRRPSHFGCVGYTSVDLEEGSFCALA